MHDIITLARFVRPYWRPAIAAFILLTALVFLDLAIPRLIQRIIDEGIAKQNQDIVIQTGLLMVGISLLSVLVAIGNNFTSIQVGEGVARDLRLALFQKIQTLSFSNLDELRTGQLLVRLTSDVAAVQRYFQINLRIGTRAPMLMIGSIILMFSTSYNLALALLPLLLITSVIVVLFVLRTEHCIAWCNSASMYSTRYCKKTLLAHVSSRHLCVGMHRRRAFWRAMMILRRTQLRSCNSWP